MEKLAFLVLELILTVFDIQQISSMCDTNNFTALDMGMQVIQASVAFLFKKPSGI
ncbi:MAG: hypothetical protein PHE67_00975 [Campylobacterales bacterium]|nr:hypothetical protein [Campylobacterales bacterium]